MKQVVAGMKWHVLVWNNTSIQWHVQVWMNTCTVWNNMWEYELIPLWYEMTIVGMMTYRGVWNVIFLVWNVNLMVWNHTIFGQGMMTYHMVWIFRMFFPDELMMMSFICSFRNQNEKHTLHISAVNQHVSCNTTEAQSEGHPPANSPPTTEPQQRRHVVSTPDRGPPKPPTPLPRSGPHYGTEFFSNTHTPGRLRGPDANDDDVFYLFFQKQKSAQRYEPQVYFPPSEGGEAV